MCGPAGITELIQGTFTSLHVFGVNRIANFQSIILMQSGSAIIRGNLILPNIAKNPAVWIGGRIEN